jgi:hypothetical protein
MWTINFEHLGIPSEQMEDRFYRHNDVPQGIEQEQMHAAWATMRELLNSGVLGPVSDDTAFTVSLSGSHVPNQPPHVTVNVSRNQALPMDTTVQRQDTSTSPAPTDAYANLDINTGNGGQE